MNLYDSILVFGLVAFCLGVIIIWLGRTVTGEPVFLFLLKSWVGEHKLSIKRTGFVLLLISLVILGFMMSEVIHQKTEVYENKTSVIKSQKYGNVTEVLDIYKTRYDIGYEEGYDAGKKNITLWLFENGGGNNQELINKCLENTRSI